MPQSPSESAGGPTTRWSPLRFAPVSTEGIFDRPGQPGVDFRARLALAGRAAHLKTDGLT